MDYVAAYFAVALVQFLLLCWLVRRDKRNGVDYTDIPDMSVFFILVGMALFWPVSMTVVVLYAIYGKITGDA